MDVRHLRSSPAVVQWKGYREASRRIHVAQPAISQTVADLEEELGLKLFTRAKRIVQLTPEGEVFHAEAVRTLAHAELAIETARRASRGEIGRLSIGFPWLCHIGISSRACAQVQSNISRCETDPSRAHSGSPGRLVRERGNRHRIHSNTHRRTEQDLLIACFVPRSAAGCPAALATREEQARAYCRFGKRELRFVPP